MSSTGQVHFINPDTLHKNPAFTNVVVIDPPVRMVFIGGQDSVDSSGTIVGKGDLRAQTEQVIHNVQAALSAAGGVPHHVVKWNLYVVNGQDLRVGFEVFQRVWGTRPNPPAISGMFVSALAHPDFLLEMDAIAAIPNYVQAA
jgi:enamine deaminase RidA (YjgF/YER057c/UK114 family)